MPTDVAGIRHDNTAPCDRVYQEFISGSRQVEQGVIRIRKADNSVIEASNVLIVAPVRPPGDWLRRAIEQVVRGAEVSYAKGPAEARALFLLKQSFSFIIISNRYSEEEIVRFIDESRVRFSGSSAAYLLHLGTDQLDAVSLAKFMAVGLHGFIGEPCTESNVTDSLVLAQKLRNQDSNGRLRAASSLMISDWVNEFISGTHQAIDIEEGLDPARFLKRCREKYKEIAGESVSQSVVSALSPLPRLQRLKSFESVRRRIWEAFQSRLTAFDKPL